MTARKARAWLVVVAALLVATPLTPPSSADTQSELAAVKERLRVLQAELNELVARHSEAEARLAETEARIEGVQADIDRVKRQVRGIQARLAERARDAYQAGGVGTVDLLLSSASLSEFSDRVEFLGRVARADRDLMIRAGVKQEELRRHREELEALRAEQAETAEALAEQEAAISAALSEMQALRGRLEKKLAAERAAAAAAVAAQARVVAGGALQACPVGQPRAYSNDFGAPRSGGRRHQGNDLLAPYGTPVYAAHGGRFEKSHNSLGGISALVYAPNGDFTYYAHMSGYAGVGDGATVSPGTAIGGVGTSGNAAGGPPHLHFEYHPGGGGAVNPYPYLRAVCG